MLQYHRVTKTLVCTPCRQAFRGKLLYKHLKTYHLGELPQGFSHTKVTHMMKDIGLASGFDAAPTMPDPCAPLKFLPDPIPGFRCTRRSKSYGTCTFCSDTAKSVITHYKKAHKDSSVPGRLRWTRVNAYQRLWSRARGFPVLNVLSGQSSDSQFSEFISRLPEALREGSWVDVGTRPSGDAETSWDTTPWLAATGWDTKLAPFSKMGLKCQTLLPKPEDGALYKLTDKKIGFILLSTNFGGIGAPSMAERSWLTRFRRYSSVLCRSLAFP